MSTVAEQLRQGREALKLDVHQVAESTKLKSDQIRALENGDYDYFTALVYLRGSVRTYANLLKLDAAKLSAQLDTELASTKKFADEGRPPEQKKGGLDALMLLLSRLNWGVTVAIILLALIALGANASCRAFKNRQSSDPLKKLGDGMYQSPESTGELLPLPTNAPRRVP